jgi:hypothetical protein
MRDRWNTLLLASLLAALLSAVFAVRVAQADGTAGETVEIRITEIPPYDAKGGPDRMETIAGTVSGIAPDKRECKIVLYARTNMWYVQPTTEAPYTSIGSDGKWQNETHLGTNYAALLVKSEWKPPATLGALPKIGGEILAIARVQGKGAVPASGN